MHAYHLVARHGEHAEWIVVAEVSFECERKVREVGARHAFGAAIEHECSIADCSWRRHDLTSVGAVSWQNPSRFNHRPGDARAAYRYVAKSEALIVSGPRDQNELERPAGREGGQPGASECKRSGSLDKHAKRDTGQRKYQAKGKEPGSIGVQYRNAANWRADMPQRICIGRPGQATASNKQEQRSRNHGRCYR